MLQVSTTLDERDCKEGDSVNWLFFALEKLELINVWQPADTAKLLRSKKYSQRKMDGSEPVWRREGEKEKEKES